MSATTAAPTATIHEPYPLSAEQIARFRDDGFIRLPAVLDAATLAHYDPEITRVTLANNKYKDVPLEQRGTYGKAFIQVTNLWCKSDVARELSFSRRVARIAAELLGVRGVRMWHDQALYKEAGGGFTPWHVDQHYWPMGSDACVTAWIPLQAVPIEMGPLSFARGSHKLNFARHLPISDDSERQIQEFVRDERLPEVFEPFATGDVSFHLGWTLHRAGPNTTATPRKVHTVIYMDQNMRLATAMSDSQKIDWQAFSPGTRPGETMADPLNPVLFSFDGAGEART